MKNIFARLVFWVFFLGVNVLTGLLMLGFQWGPGLGLFAFAVTVLLAYGMAGRIFLVAAQSAFLPPGGKLAERVNNISFCLGLPPVDLFVSKQLPDNIYVLNSLLGRPCLLVTPKIQSLDRESLDFLICEALAKVKSNDSLHNTAVAAVFTLLEFPFQLLTRWSWTYYPGLVCGFLLIPVVNLKNCIMRSGDSRVNAQARIQVASLFPHRRQSVDSMIRSMAQDLGVIRFSENDLWNSVVNQGLSAGWFNLTHQR